MKLYPLIVIKREIEYLLLLPFIIIGKLVAKFNPLDQEYDLFCFYPIYGLGGAEKVNADVVKSFAGKKIIIFFTKHSEDKTTLDLFQQSNTVIKDISKYTNRAQSFSNFVYRGVCAYYINAQKKKPSVFNGQCNFAYKLLPHLKRSIRKVELIHCSEKRFTNITYPYISYIDARVMPALAIAADHKRFYDNIGIPEKYKARINIVHYKLNFPIEKEFHREYSEPLKVCYAGRGGHQKRINLLVKIIQGCKLLKLPIEFHLAGNFQDEVPADVMDGCVYHGVIKSGVNMYQFLQQMDILVMTSAFEGFPVIIMESMANGVIPVVTAVDGIPEHIRHGVNGFLISDAQNEEKVVSQGIEILQKMCSDRPSLPVLSRNGFLYAKEHFNSDQFDLKYRNLLGF